MRRVSLSGSEKTVGAIWDWYEVQSRLALAKKSQLLQEIRSSHRVSDPTFFGMTTEEIDDFFCELDLLTMLDLLASAEAAIRVDFLNRVYRRLKDDVSRQFRTLYKANGNSIRLEDVLNVWKDLVPEIKNQVGDFNGALLLRHWLAHGRYWTPKFGRDYYPGDVYDISLRLINAIST